MHAFEQKPEATQQTTSAKSTTPGHSNLGHGPEMEWILQLQSTIGNQAVQRMLRADAQAHEAGLADAPRFGHDFSRAPKDPSAAETIQAAPAMNEPGDSYQQKEGRVAARAHVQAGVTGQIAAPPIVHKVLRSPGQPLDPAIRAFMEPRFGQDFSQVRVHTDAHAAESARAVNALAYTVGNSMVFGANQYAPATHHGRELLGHELAHTVQQRAGGAPPSRDSNGIYEASAKAAGRTVASGGAVISDLPACGMGLSRSPDSTEDLSEVETRKKEEARELQEVTERLKQPNYPGRERDLAIKDALSMVLEEDEEDQEEPTSRVSMDLSSGKPVIAGPTTSRDTTPSKFSPGGFTDKDIYDALYDPEFAEYKRGEEAVEKVRIEQEKEENESRPKRLMELRKILYEHGYRKGQIKDALLKLPPLDRQLLRRHGLEWPKWYTKRATFQNEVIEAIDSYVSETTSGNAPVLKESTQADQTAREKQDKEKRILKAQLEGYGATRGSFLGAVSGGVARGFTDDEEKIAAFAKGGATLGGIVAPFAQAKGQQLSYVPQVQNAPGWSRYSGTAPTVEVNTPKLPTGTTETSPIPTIPRFTDVTGRSSFSPIPTIPRFTDVTGRSSFSAFRPRTPDDEYVDFLRMLRGETGSDEFRAGGEPFSMQPHSGAREARQTIGVSGSTHQSMHGFPRSTGRGVPGYNPRAALTMIEETGIHTGMDAHWKQAFQGMRRSGGTEATAQTIYDTLAESIQRSPDLSQGIKDSLKRRLHDEMFVEYGLAPGENLPLPYPNIPPSTP